MNPHLKERARHHGTSGRANHLAATLILIAPLFGGFESPVFAVNCAWGTATSTQLSMNAATCNVGINMTSGPLFRLDLGGSPRLALDPTTTSPDATTLLFGDGTGWKLHFGKRSDSGGTKFMTVQDNGNVGVGTQAPYSKIGLLGNSSDPTLLHGGAGIFNVADGLTDLVFTISASNPFGASIQHRHYSVESVYYPINLNPLGGNVGIGTVAPNIYGYVAPATVLTVKGWGAAGSGVLELAHSYPDASGNTAGIVAYTDPQQSVEKRVGAILGVTDGSAASNRGGYLNFWTKADGGSLSERMRIDRNGNVGIATSSPDPAYKLHVAGAVRVDGNIAAKYQDVAEWVPTRRHLDAGTVVIVDPDHSNEVAPSDRAYDTRVAGVTSAKPGVVLGEAGDGKVMIATTGRVRVKADANPGCIHAGDLLVTSDREGYAMRSEPIEVAGVKIHRPGTLVGKALEPLESGQGEILVLLSLQ